MNNANARQVGGAHYGPGKGVQHWDWARQLPYLPGVLTKYICRHKTSGKPNDLAKALHYAEKIEERPKVIALSEIADIYALSPLEAQICSWAANGENVVELVKELLRNPR